MTETKPWIIKAQKYLKESLSPIPHELNELDWKARLSEDSQRIAQHISAFANQAGGGYFAFGIRQDGAIEGVSSPDVEKIIQRIAAIARDGLDPSQKIDHFIDTVSDKAVLFLYIFENNQKPVHVRGKGIEYSYLRSGGQTRKMNQHEIAHAVLHSRQVRFEELEAISCSVDSALKLLDYEKLFQLLHLPEAGSESAAMDQLINHKMVYRKTTELSITNLGAIIAARNLSQFPGKERLTVRVIKYKGSSKIETQIEKEFFSGYGVGFQEIIRYVMDQLPTSEIIKDALRSNVPIYPEITMRELIANALIHRDFSITGTHPMVEIFSDRIEITSPGQLLPTVSVERLIDSTPESRNEILAGVMRRMGICEERGSGIDKALFAVEVYGLPPIEFVNGPNMFKAILFNPKKFKSMSPPERLRACFQHCCLKYVSGERMTNTTFRKRLGLKDSQYALAWKIIDSAIELKLIKPYEMAGASRKYASYVPYWA